MNTTVYHIFRVFLVVLVIGVIPSCGSSKNEENKEEPPVEELYQTANDLLEKRKYKKAIENYQEVERLYPFSKLATKSQVMVAYAYYKDEEYDDAVNVIDRFVKLHPGNVDVEYMYYLKAISYYDRISDVKRDQQITEKALSALQEMVRRFPQGEYARDAKLKIDLVRDHLAGKEMEIARFYLKQRKYIAATNRFQSVIDNYETTSHVPEALYRLTESYLLMGITEEAHKNAAVLGHNYPDSKWYKYAYRLVQEGENSPKDKSGSWFNTILAREDESSKSKELVRENEVDTRVEKVKSVD